jgi:hypothetical protein
LLLTGSLSITDDGALDIAKGRLIIRSAAGAGSIAAAGAAAWIAQARAGRWQGAGLTSSAAAGNSILGVAAILNDRGDGSPIFDTFAGQAVDADSVLIQAVLNGDTDLNGVIDGDDYHCIDRGFLLQMPGYRNGDLDYSGGVDADDYFLIDSAFLGQRTLPESWRNPPGAFAGASVPEPGPAMWLTLAAGLLLAGRVRRSTTKSRDPGTRAATACEAGVNPSARIPL